MTARTRNRRAIAIGGSMSGLFAAAFLRRIGWDVDVFERSPVELVGRGAGITTHPELLEALERSGAGTRDLGVEVEKRIALDRHGRVTAEKLRSMPPLPRNEHRAVLRVGLTACTSWHIAGGAPVALVTLPVLIPSLVARLPRGA